MRWLARFGLFHLFAAALFVLDFGVMQPGVDAVAEAQTSGGGTNPVMSGSLDLTAVNNNVVMPVLNGQGVLGVDLFGLTGSGATVVTETTVDQIHWSAANMLVVGSGGAFATSITSDSSFRVNTAGKTWVRIRVSSAGTGSVAIGLTLSTDSSIVQFSAPLPPGSNQIGGVTVSNFPASFNIGNFPATQPVTGTFWQATQPVSIASTVNTAAAPCANAPTTQVAVGTSAVQIIAARAGRIKLTTSPTTNATYYVSPSPTVTTATGLAVTSGGVYTINTALAYYAVAPAAMMLSVQECY